MQENSLLQNEGTIYRILDSAEDRILLIDCINRTMPKWYDAATINHFQPATEDDLQAQSQVDLFDIDSLDAASRRTVHERFTMIAGVLPFVADDKLRSLTISRIAEDRNVCKQTIRNYLCLYLAYQDISALAPKRSKDDKPLTRDEKNMRWALNKFFYTQNKNSLNTAYTYMLKERYTDGLGNLSTEHPTFNQFRYFYRKHRKMQTYYIARNGLKDYQRNSRPLTGDHIQSFAPAIGVGMLDSTICDIYLVDEAHNLVGRPILTACVDAFSGLCCGYTLSWEGGVYSLRGLVTSIISDKAEWCKRFGINIQPEEWNCSQLPATLVTDKGSEYKSANFEQIAELGVTVVNLPSYRPELKGAVEKFFDLVQNIYKPYLKGKGVIEPDYQERGAHDYRKDACLTLEAFETVILRCIIYYNSKRIIENFPYTQEMLSSKVPPHSSDIWNWNMSQPGANLISVERERLLLTLLPRTTGTFSRHGLKVNKLRYHHEGYIESYLQGGTVTVAYNPDDVSSVWIVENGTYTQFELIESRFAGKELTAVQEMQSAQKGIIKDAVQDNLQAKITLAEHISAIASNAGCTGTTSTKSIRENRKREQRKKHIDHMKTGNGNEQAD